MLESGNASSCNEVLHFAVSKVSVYCLLYAEFMFFLKDAAQYDIISQPLQEM